MSILVEPAGDWLLFKRLEDWEAFKQDVYASHRDLVAGTPSRFPCYGIPAGFSSNGDGPTLRFFSYVYPELPPVGGKMSDYDCENMAIQIKRMADITDVSPADYFERLISANFFTQEESAEMAQYFDYDDPASKTR